MFVRDLLKYNDVVSCHDSDVALRCLRLLRMQIGASTVGYVDTRVLSECQTEAAEDAITMAVSHDYVGVLNNLYNFLDNDGDNEHELTNSEFGLLNLVLHVCYL